MTRFVIGRSADNDIVVSDASVSRIHAELRPVPGEACFHLVDLGSTYGTGILREGHWIQVQKSDVEGGDPIRLGDYVTSARELFGMAGIDPNADPDLDPDAMEQPETKRNRLRRGQPGPMEREQTTIPGVPKKRAWLFIAAAGALVLASVVAGAAVMLVGSDTSQDFVEACLAKGNTPQSCRCVADVLDRNMNDQDFRVIVNNYRDTAWPRLAIAGKLLKLGPLVFDCYK